MQPAIPFNVPLPAVNQLQTLKKKKKKTKTEFYFVV